MIDNIFYLPKEIIKSSVILNNIYLHLNHKEKLISDENIAVVGFPRVGNTFAGRVLKLAFENRNCKLVNHYHSAAQAIYSSKKNIPTILITRNPRDVILSLKIYYQGINNISINSHIFRFLIYHLRILLSNTDMLIIDFDEFTKNPNILIKKINSKYHLKLNENIEDLENKVFSSIRRDNKFKPENKFKISSPSAEKKSLKKGLKSSVDNNFFIKLAEYIYTKIKNKYNQ